MWQKVTDVAPRGMLDSLGTMNPREKTIFLCGGFRCPYVRDWQPLYLAVARYISALYVTRCRLVGDVL